MVILKHDHKVYPTVVDAEHAADILNIADNDGWTYKVVPDPLGTGKAIIHIYEDEDGEFIATY